MLNLKIPLGETLFLSERLPSGEVRELGQVMLDHYSAGKVELVWDVPEELEVERGAAREKRLARERLLHPPAARESAQGRAKRAQRERQATVYCHLFENGRFVRTVTGVRGGPLTQGEAQNHGWHWQKSAQGRGVRGFVISADPKPI